MREEIQSLKDECFEKAKNALQLSRGSFTSNFTSDLDKLYLECKAEHYLEFVNELTRILKQTQ